MDHFPDAGSLDHQLAVDILCDQLAVWCLDEYYADRRGGPDYAGGEEMRKPSPFRAPPFPFEPETDIAFERALEASGHTTDSIETLRAAVTACVLHLKKIGMEPEAVLVTMRAYLSHTLRTHSQTSVPVPLWETSWLGEQVAKWSIDAYFPAD